ncbi:DivIVA domain-containing protein [Kocuria tytonis]|uniref:DivIVA domain-containing protein n=1 Tax=Kocuria tytonis TaxID=2054280 RepID=A0A495A1L4_9MICC|nr:DivIVA domain-containing protein [Kocuria tytonis]RKQ33369.1 DivIVA domain-containing protein [Kocuria tytonis]
MTSQDRFPRVAERAWGYDPAQVDDFLDRVAAVLDSSTPPSPTPADGAGPHPGSENAGTGSNRTGSGATGPERAEDGGAGSDRTGSGAAGSGRTGSGASSSADPGGAARRMGSRQVRERVFDRVQGGYDPVAVDLHLDEVEDDLFAREHRAFVAEHGVQRWNEHVELLGQLLLGRLNRPRSERFRRPAKHRTVGYSAADVDVLCDRLMEQLRDAPDVDPRLLRTAVFRPAQGQRCYEEQQVDAFLDRAVEFILAVRVVSRAS